MNGSDRRHKALAEVMACVCKDRMNAYGDAEDNFSEIAAIASIVLRSKLKEPLNARDVAALMCCVKLARLRTSPDHRDSWIDLSGYAVCGAGIIEASKETPK